MKRNETNVKPLGADDTKDKANRRCDGGGPDDTAGAIGQRAGHCVAGIRWYPAADH